jgi:hypothetical protein
LSQLCGQFPLQSFDFIFTGTQLSARPWEEKKCLRMLERSRETNETSATTWRTICRKIQFATTTHVDDCFDIPTTCPPLSDACLPARKCLASVPNDRQQLHPFPYEHPSVVIVIVVVAVNEKVSTDERASKLHTNKITLNNRH